MSTPVGVGNFSTMFPIAPEALYERSWAGSMPLPWSTQHCYNHVLAFTEYMVSIDQDFVKANTRILSTVNLTNLRLFS